VATIDMGRKEGAAVPLSRGGAGSPFNTMWPPRSTYVPSGFLIHPAVWPQYIDTGLKLGSIPILRGGGEELRPHLTQPRLGRGLPPYQVAS